MLDALLNGIQVGIALSLLIGPIFFALIQAGVEKGFRAGAAVGFGIWISDGLFMCLAYFGVSLIQQALEFEHFELYLGIIGGILLIGFGLASIISRPDFLVQHAIADNDELLDFPPHSKPPITTAQYSMLITKGFLLNTVNPFTILFWVAITSTVLAQKEIDGQFAIWFFLGILGTIITTDLAKVLLSKYLSKRLKNNHILWFRRISGAALIVFGLVLIIRVSI